jgi:hypothetical protein
MLRQKPLLIFDENMGGERGGGVRILLFPLIFSTLIRNLLLLIISFINTE